MSPRKQKITIVSDIDDTVTERDFPFFATPNQCTLNFLKKMKARGATIFYATSRPKFLRTYTHKWLKKHDFPDHDNLFMGVPTPEGKFAKVTQLCEDPKRCIYVENHDKARKIVSERFGARVIDPNDCNDFPEID